MIDPILVFDGRRLLKLADYNTVSNAWWTRFQTTYFKRERKYPLFLGGAGKGQSSSKMFLLRRGMTASSIWDYIVYRRVWQNVFEGGGGGC